MKIIGIKCPSCGKVTCLTIGFFGDTHSFGRCECEYCGHEKVPFVEPREFIVDNDYLPEE